MRKITYIPNIFLTRELFCENCTVGTLCDAEGKFLCNTLEPRWRDIGNGARVVKGHTCIPAGIYPIDFSYDSHLKYKCPRLKMTTGFLNIRICFISKSGSKPSHTLGNILLGYVKEEVVRRLDGEVVSRLDGEMVRRLDGEMVSENSIDHKSELTVEDFDGTLYNPALAFKTIKDLFESMRANRGNMVLQITDLFKPTSFLKLDLPEDGDELLDEEDFMLATL